MNTSLASLKEPPPSATRQSLSFWALHSADIALVAAVLLAACGHLLIKYGLKTSAGPRELTGLARIVALMFSARVLTGLAVYGVGTVLWVAVVAKRPISYLYPVTAMNYVLITLGGMWFFGEAVSAARWLGIAVVIFGVVLMQTSVERKP